MSTATSLTCALRYRFGMYSADVVNTLVERSSRNLKLRRVFNFKLQVMYIISNAEGKKPQVLGRKITANKESIAGSTGASPFV